MQFLNREKGKEEKKSPKETLLDALSFGFVYWLLLGGMFLYARQRLNLYDWQGAGESSNRQPEVIDVTLLEQLVLKRLQ